MNFSEIHYRLSITLGCSSGKEDMQQKTQQYISPHLHKLEKPGLQRPKVLLVFVYFVKGI